MIKESPYKIDGLEFETQEEYREYLSKSNKYSNAYEPWTDELDEELKRLSIKLSTKELALHFCRRNEAIISRLKKLDAVVNKKINEKQVINAIIDGCNPVTGELFDEDSIWTHPKIKDDLKKWIKD